MEKGRHFNLLLKPYTTLPDSRELNSLPVHVMKRKSLDGMTYVVVLGMSHTSNPVDEQFATISKQFDSWKDKTADKRRILIVEGRTLTFIQDKPPLINSEVGERALPPYWGNKYDIEVVSAEPQPMFDEAQRVLAQIDRSFSPDVEKNFSSKDLVAQYYILRTLRQYFDTPEDQRIEWSSYINGWLDQYRYVWKWEDYDFSYENQNRIHQGLYGQPLEKVTKEFIIDQTANFKYSQTPVQKIAQTVAGIRDQHLTKIIIDYAEEGTSVFVLHNKLHTYRIEDIIIAWGTSD